MKTMPRRIVQELAEHTPFTLVGAAIGILIMVIIHFTNTPGKVSEALFYTFHPLHIVFSAIVTTAMYKKQKNSPLWLIIVVGYTGSIGIATLSDAIIPYLGGNALRITMEFHLPFIETETMPYMGIPEWIIVNAAATIGIAIGYFKPTTKLPHMGHVLLSTWASLFSFTAFGVANWISILPFIFLFLFIAVWLPCCVSDIIYPLLWVRNK